MKSVASATARHVADALATIAAGANCSLQTYKKVKVPDFKVTGDVIAYASPDSTYAVTKRLFENAKKSILIGIYDFTASYVRDLLIKAMGRGVKVELLLDLTGSAEQKVFDRLQQLGAKVLRAPSCANPKITARYFSVVHQKVVIVDDEWTLVQSGNYSNNSIPQNEKDGGDTPFVPGNRDTGVAVRSTQMAAFFKKRLANDRRLVLGQAEIDALGTLAQSEFQSDQVFVAAPTMSPKKKFPSKTFKKAGGIPLQPVYTPDNYLAVVVPWLESATKSILIEQQYIRSWQPQVKKLIAAMAAAQKKHALDIRIVLGKAFGPDDVTKANQMIKDLRAALGLKRGTHVRFINQDRFVHCHNKLIIVDGRSALVSSQNWSGTAVATNREAGVIINDAAIAKYYTAIFESDFETGVTQPMKKKPTLVDAQAFATGKVVAVDLGDFAEV